jgi:hypothetical protein
MICLEFLWYIALTLSLLSNSARDLYFVTATAFAEANARRPQITIISTSIPHSGASKATDEASTSTTTPAQPRPRAHLHLSAWILEGIDPYSSNHPIPSTRVTFMTALDLGGSVPQRISGMIQTMFPKMITQVESYLQTQAAPPIIRIPEQMVVGENPCKFWTMPWKYSRVNFIWLILNIPTLFFFDNF